MMDRKPGHLTKNPQQSVNSLVWIKLVGVGNMNTGKTCLIKHFCESKFSNAYQPTVGVDYGFKIQPVCGIDLRVHLWDLSGNSEYLDVRNELYGATDAIFLVYDVSNLASFDNLETWLREIAKHTPGNPERVVVANKGDLKSKRLISGNDGRKWAKDHKMQYYETSAATGEGVERLFTDMLKTVIEKKKIITASSAGMVS